VLVGCKKVKLLDRDLEHGREVSLANATSVSHYGCGGDSCLVAAAAQGDTLIMDRDDGCTGTRDAFPLAKRHLLAVHLPDGAHEPYQVTDAGLNLERPMDREDLPVLQGGVKVVTYGDSLREIDPRNDEVLWERGILGAMKPTLLSVDGAEVIAVRESVGNRPSQVLLFKRGAPTEPLWTGKVYGTVTEGRAPVVEAIVKIGEVMRQTDDKGNYEIPFSGRGSYAMEAATGVPRSKTTTIELVAGHGPYKVDLTITEFSQACGG